VLLATPLQVDEAFLGDVRLIKGHGLRLVLAYLLLGRVGLTLEVAQLRLAVSLRLRRLQIIVRQQMNALRFQLDRSGTEAPGSSVAFIARR
jgi:hypothetical protein